MAGSNLPFNLADQSLAQFDSFVNGQPIVAKSGKRFDVMDPGSGSVWASCPDCDEHDVDEAVQSSYQAFLAYSRWTPNQRARCLLRWWELIVAAREDLARILVHETGKPLAEAYSEIDYGCSFVWWFTSEAERIQGSTITSSAVPIRRGLTIKRPIGVATALVPWNFPLALLLRKASAAFAAGCTVVAKPSPETPVTALGLARLALTAGFPPGALNVLTTSIENTPRLAEALCLHPLIKKVTFTGSTRVGKLVASMCASNLKKSTLELGGNCPLVVFDDADLRQLIGQFIALKWRHAGQACVAPNRVYVQRGLHDDLVRAVVEQTSLMKVGHGMASDTNMGPVSSSRSLDRLERVVDDALARGAKLVFGSGRRRPGPGYFMEPSVLVGVTDDMLISREEVFGPLLGISVFDSEQEVIARANDTAMGLSAYVFTKNVDCIWRMFEKLEAGMIGLNSVGTSSAEVPFGGMKESGYGKESGKDVAIDEFLITKSATLAFEEL